MAWLKFILRIRVATLVLHCRCGAWWVICGGVVDGQAGRPRLNPLHALPLQQTPLPQHTSGGLRPVHSFRRFFCHPSIWSLSVPPPSCSLPLGTD